MQTRVTEADESFPGDKRRDREAHEETFGGDGYVYYLECTNGFIVCIYMSKLKLYT